MLPKGIFLVKMEISSILYFTHTIILSSQLSIVSLITSMWQVANYIAVSIGLLFPTEGF
jgi:hypothetical protein